MAAATTARLKRAELTSGVGAVVLGVGLGALLARQIGPFHLPLLALGVLVHGWGMLDKHRIEASTSSQLWWSDALYWSCWILLIGLIGYVAVRAATG